jgi:hypothetical protein
MLTDDSFSAERVPATPFVSKVLKQSATKEVTLELAKTPTKLLIRQKKAT